MIVKLLPLKSLKVLQLTWNYELTHAVLPILNQLPALEHVDLHDTGFAPPPMVARRFAERLKSFSYSAPTRSGQEVFTLDDFREIVTLPRHTWDYPHRTDVPLADIVALLPGPVTHLSSTEWYYEIKLGGADAEGKKFSLSISRPLSDEDLETAGRMTELRSLSVRADTHEGLRRLTELAKLEFLSIASSRKLTSDSLTALSKMPSLRRAELRGIDLDADSLAWIRTATRLESLTLLDGTVSGDALADLVHARNLHNLKLGNQEIYGTVQSVSLTPPTRPVQIDNIKRLTLVSTGLTVEQCEVLGRFRSLESLVLTAPVTDAHLRCLTPLERLSRLTVKLTTTREREESVPAGKITPHGIQQLRSIKTPIYLDLEVPIADSELEEAMAHQFG